MNRAGISVNPINEGRRRKPRGARSLMATLISPPGPKRRFWSLLTPLTPSKEFTLKLPLRRAFAGERAGPVAKQREGEVVGVAEAVCGWIDSDPPHPASPPAKTRAERGMSMSADM